MRVLLTAGHTVNPPYALEVSHFPVRQEVKVHRVHGPGPTFTFWVALPNLGFTYFLPFFLGGGIGDSSSSSGASSVSCSSTSSVSSSISSSASPSSKLEPCSASMK